MGLGLLCLGVWVSAHAAQDVQGVWGSYKAVATDPIWTSTVSGYSSAAIANGNNDLLAFTVGTGASALTFSTGVNDSLLAPGTFTPAGFQAFTPSVASIPATGGLNAIAISGTYDRSKTRASYLSDGSHGLDLNTALFNIPSTKLKFDAVVANASATTDAVPDVLVTQVGEPSKTNSDYFYFVDSVGARVGNSVAISFVSVSPVGRQQWQFWNPDHSKSSIANGPRDLRMRAYYFADFGITSANMGQVAGFVQELSGDSDVSFVAYNQQAVSTPANVSVQKTNNVDVVTAGRNTTYTVTLRNTGGTEASDVQWSDNASNLQVTSISANSTSADAGVCSINGCTGIKLAAGSEFSYTVEATVPASVGLTARNSAVVDGGNCVAGSPSTCTDTDSDPIVSASSLSIVKTNNVSTLPMGGQTNYQVTVTNNSGSAFSSLSWSDVPSGMTLNSILSGTAGTGSVAGACQITAPVGCSGITLAAGQSITYYVVATVNSGVTAGSTVRNTATLSGGTCTSGSQTGCSSVDSDGIVGPANLNMLWL